MLDRRQPFCEFLFTLLIQQINFKIGMEARHVKLPKTVSQGEVSFFTKINHIPNNWIAKSILGLSFSIHNICRALFILNQSLYGRLINLDYLTIDNFYLHYIIYNACQKYLEFTLYLISFIPFIPEKKIGTSAPPPLPPKTMLIV